MHVLKVHSLQHYRTLQMSLASRSAKRIDFTHLHPVRPKILLKRCNATLGRHFNTRVSYGLIPLVRCDATLNAENNGLIPLVRSDATLGVKNNGLR